MMERPGAGRGRPARARHPVERHAHGPFCTLRRSRRTGARRPRARRVRHSRQAVRPPRSPPATDVETNPDLGAAWLDDGRMIGLVTLGSSTCVPVGRCADLRGRGAGRHCSPRRPSQACTRDLVPRVTLVTVPEDVDPEKDLQIEVTGDDYSRPGRARRRRRPRRPAARPTTTRAPAGPTTPGQFVILTWGSSTCVPVIEDVAATGPAEVTVTYQTRPTTRCAPWTWRRALGHRGERPRGRSDVQLILTGGGFDNVKSRSTARTPPAPRARRAGPAPARRRRWSGPGATGPGRPIWLRSHFWRRPRPEATKGDCGAACWSPAVRDARRSFVPQSLLVANSAQKRPKVTAEQHVGRPPFGMLYVRPFRSQLLGQSAARGRQNVTAARGVRDAPSELHTRCGIGEEQ